MVGQQIMCLLATCVLSMCVYDSVVVCSPCAPSISLVAREVSVVHWAPLNIIIDIVGWIYFVAWSISFYPQVSKLAHNRGAQHIVTERERDR